MLASSFSLPIHRGLFLRERNSVRLDKFFRQRDDLVVQVLPDSSVDLLWSRSPVKVGLGPFEYTWGHVGHVPVWYFSG
jgi:hypothetical protein